MKRLVASVLAALLSLAAVPQAYATGDRPGDFDYYALVLSWSPSYCLGGNGSRDGDPQCGTSRPYAFVLHGLWPQFDRHWPEDCGSGQDTTVPERMATSMLDIMPSPKLVQHEYEKHGTCSGLSMTDYFGLARRLFTSIVVPAKYVNLSGRLDVPLATLRSDLLAANPRLTPDMIAVDCDKHGQLVEVHFCFTKDGQPKDCGHNEIQAKMCRTDTVSMPPVRGRVAGAGNDNASATAPAAASADAGQADSQANDASGNDNSSAPASRHRHRHHHHSYIFFSN